MPQKPKSRSDETGKETQINSVPKSQVHEAKTKAGKKPDTEVKSGKTSNSQRYRHIQEPRPLL